MIQTTKTVVCKVLFASFTATMFMGVVKANEAVIIEQETRGVKPEALESSSIAFFEAFDKKPCLRVFNPIEYKYVAIDFDADLSKLAMTKRTSVNLLFDVISEELFEGADIKGFDIARKLTHQTTRAGQPDPLVEIYKDGTPLCMTFKNQKEATIVLNQLKDSLEKAGVTPHLKKPVLVLIIDKKSNVGLDNLQEAFVNAYFTRTTFSDAYVKRTFLDAQAAMAKALRDTMSNPTKEYASDGIVGNVTRTLNKDLDKLKMDKNAANLILYAKYLAIGIPVAVITSYVYEVVKNKGHVAIDKYTNGWFATSKQDLDKHLKEFKPTT